MKTLFTALIVVLVASGAQAAPASAESIESLLVITQAEAMIDSMYANLEQKMQQGLLQGAKGQALTARQQRILDKMPGKFVALMRTELNWQTLRPQYVQIYQEIFNQQEIDGMLAFYRSESGQALINKMPAAIQKSMAVGQSQLQILQPKMRAAMEEALAEAKLTK